VSTRASFKDRCLVASHFPQYTTFVSKCGRNLSIMGEVKTVLLKMFIYLTTNTVNGKVYVGQQRQAAA